MGPIFLAYPRRQRRLLARRNQHAARCGNVSRVANRRRPASGTVAPRRAGQLVEVASPGGGCCKFGDKPVSGKGKRKKIEAVGYMRTSSASNVGADKDSEQRQRTGIEAYAKHAGSS